MLTKKRLSKNIYHALLPQFFKVYCTLFLAITPLKMLFIFASYKFFFSYLIIKAKKRKQTSLQKTNNTPIHHEMLHTIVLQKTPL